MSYVASQTTCHPSTYISTSSFQLLASSLQSSRVEYLIVESTQFSTQKLGSPIATLLLISQLVELQSSYKIFKMDLTRSLRDAFKSAIIFLISTPYNFENINFQGPKRSRILSFSMAETLHIQFAPLHLLVAALDISYGCNTEIDSIEGVAFHYVDNSAMLILIFLSNCDINKCSTNVLTLRSICAQNFLQVKIYRSTTSFQLLPKQYLPITSRYSSTSTKS